MADSSIAAVSASIPAPLGLFGGTFDPVHWGHLRVASEAAVALRLAQVRLIPSKTPVHRARPGASESERLAMLRLAVAGHPALAVDDCELRRDTPSYTALTLAALRQALPTTPLVWLIGIDAFVHINRWYDWQRLFELAHFVVLNRPGFAVSQALTPALAEVWQGRLSSDRGVLHERTHGAIYIHTVTPQAVSATEIRNTIAAGADDAALHALLPAPVLAYIREHQLYTSST